MRIFELERGYASSSSTAKSKNKKSLLNLDEQTLTINGMMNVYNNLPNNSKRVLILIFNEWIEHQEFKKLIKKSTREEDENSSGKGLDFERIFGKCKEDFLVTSRGVLKNRLVEFEDHNLMKKVRSDGSDFISVQIEHHLIQMFLSEIEKEEN